MKYQPSLSNWTATHALSLQEAERYACELTTRYAQHNVWEHVLSGNEPWQEHPGDVFDVKLCAGRAELAGRFSSFEFGKMLEALENVFDVPAVSPELILELHEELAKALRDHKFRSARSLMPSLFQDVDDGVLVSKVAALSVVQRAALIHTLVRVAFDENPFRSCLEDFCHHAGLVLSDSIRT
ncbi:hypothetical protein THIX_10026 [Thiomonas sp. X19]|uniref:hypothetical protein n=1 Tax=Thiomonas sp. X19 TaxID=1050370 RepID=UPI000B655A9A|nr:hypothetical protein [Thiomonas sp. X19]SCC90985.1 hypothetical protein THIX_10026 [Thiomonas sp. X19]